jgi:aspartyl-tRNA(Asn)/glutamyl-tRNA(Gln) amidotransferase subunit C
MTNSGADDTPEPVVLRFVVKAQGCSALSSFMALTFDDVLRIAHLARIDIDAPAAREVHAKLDAIFMLINELQAVDTTGIEPMSHAQDVSAPLRDDAVTESDHHADYQRVAPAVEDGLYLVPRVIE